MKSTLITSLETICPGNVYLQGTLNKADAYPDEFITFWTDFTDYNSHYDNDVHSVDWSFSVIFYSNDPDRVKTVPGTITSTLKAEGFIPQGKGSDILSDEQSHTGWAMDFKITEYQTTEGD